MKKLRAWLLALASLPAGVGAETLYRVEILVFAQPSPPANQIRRLESAPRLELARAVDFRQYPCLPATAHSRSLQMFRSEEDVELCLNGYLRLNELGQMMVAERIRLEKSGQFRILHHAAWQQPAALPDEIRPIRLTNGVALPSASAESPALDGTVRLSREQFLQLDVELLYHYPAPGAEEAAGSDGLLLRSNRKLRPNELNYIDHPFLGVLAQVTPVAKEEPR